MKHIWILDPIYIGRTKQWRNSRPWTRDNRVLRCKITLYPFRVETLNGVNRIFSTLPISSMSGGITVTQIKHRKRRRNHARTECLTRRHQETASHTCLFEARVIIDYLRRCRFCKRGKLLTFVNTYAAKDDCIIITRVARL